MLMHLEHNTTGKDILDKTNKDNILLQSKGLKVLKTKTTWKYGTSQTALVLLHKWENLGHVPVFAFIRPCPPDN